MVNDDLLDELLDGLVVVVASGDPVMELLEVETFACFESRLRILSSVLLHWPGVVSAEVEQVPKFGIPARRLQNVAIVDIWVGKHGRDHIFQPFVVVLDLMGAKQILQSMLFIIVINHFSESVKQHNIHSDLRLIIHHLQAPLHSRDTVQAHCSAAIYIDSTIDLLWCEQERNAS